MKDTNPYCQSLTGARKGWGASSQRQKCAALALEGLQLCAAHAKMLGYLRCAACGVWRPPIHSSVRGIGRTGSSIVTRNGPCECPPLDARAHAGDGDSANREAMAIYHEINDRNKGGDT